MAPGRPPAIARDRPVGTAPFGDATIDDDLDGVAAVGVAEILEAPGLVPDDDQEDAAHLPPSPTGLPRRRDAL